MFDFQKEVIINSAEVDGLTRVKVEGEYLKVLRCADYKLANITEIVKTVGQKGSADSLPLSLNSVGASSGDIVHVEIELSLRGEYTADFANVWSKFGKTIVVEGTVTDTISASDAIAKALKNYSDILTVNSEKLIEFKNPATIVKSAKCWVVPADGKEPEIKILAPNKGKAEFATGEWLQKNLRFPTHLNLRYAGTAGDEAPIEGATYTQYSFQYESERKGLHGQGTVGQKLTSVTTHTFYVNNNLEGVLGVFDSLLVDDDPKTEGVVEGVTPNGNGETYPVLEPLVRPQDEDGEDKLAQ